MKLQTLFERKDHPRVKIFSDEALNKFRAIGHKYQVVLGSALAWPRISKKRVAFGASIRDADRGAGNLKIDEPKHERLPLEIRIRGFIAALSKELIGYMERGQEVRVMKGRHASTEGIVATPETIQKLLTDNVQHDTTFDRDVPKGEVIVWSVAVPLEEEKRVPYQIDTELTFTDDGEYKTLKNKRFYKSVRVSYGTISDDPEIANLIDSVFEINTTLRETEPNSAEIVRIFKDILDKTSGKKFPYIPRYAPLYRMKVKATKDVYISRTAIKLSPEDFKAKVLEPLIRHQEVWVD